MTLGSYPMDGSAAVNRVRLRKGRSIRPRATPAPRRPLPVGASEQPALVRRAIATHAIDLQPWTRGVVLPRHDVAGLLVMG